MKLVKIFKDQPHFIVAVIVFTMAVTINALDEFRLINNSTSSTAAIGFIFLPLTALIVSLPWLGVGIALSYALKAIRTQGKNDVVLAILGIVLSLTYITYAGMAHQKKLGLIEAIGQIQLMNTKQLTAFVENARYRDSKFALGAICLNQNTASNTLAHIAEMENPALHKAMWSDPLIMGKNRKGLAVMRLIVSHPNVTPAILSLLSNSPVSYVKGDVAADMHTPTGVLDRLYQENKNSTEFYLIEWGLSRNPSTPAPILNALANSKDKVTLRNLNNNPSTPANN